MPSLTSLKVHWRAPLQTKGFLRIIQFCLAILTFSLVAGFHFSGYIHCDADSKEAAVTLNFNYPYSSYSYNNNSAKVTSSLPYSKARSSSQLFVAWGVLSLFYCLIALAVYMLLTANEELERVVDAMVYTDLAFNIAWVLCWFIACVEWSVAFKGMQNSIKDDVFPVIKNRTVPTPCSNATAIVTRLDTFEQAAIASVFGFLCCLVWTASIYWVFIDTALFIKWRARRQQPYSNM